MAFVSLNNLSVFLLMYMYVSINFVIGFCEYTCAFASIALLCFLALHCFFCEPRLFFSFFLNDRCFTVLDVLRFYLIPCVLLLYFA